MTDHAWSKAALVADLLSWAAHLEEQGQPHPAKYMRRAVTALTTREHDQQVRHAKAIEREVKELQERGYQVEVWRERGVPTDHPRDEEGYPLGFIERYTCGCIRRVNWERCDRHAELRGREV